MISIRRTRNWTTAAFAAFAVLALGTVATRATAQEVTEQNVAERIATMKTPQDHEAIAAYFKKQAAAAAEQVKEHEAMLASWKKSMSGRSLVNMEHHCEGLISAYKKIQKDDEALAQLHENMAKAAAGK
jgi:hypothetical protein